MGITLPIIIGASMGGLGKCTGGLRSPLLFAVELIKVQGTALKLLSRVCGICEGEFWSIGGRCGRCVLRCVFSMYSRIYKWGLSGGGW